MNKRIRRKINKGKFWFHKSQMLWQHHAYQPDQRTKEVMLAYAEDGNERCFKNWKDAKRYLRTMPARVYDDFPF